jgi:hypothetical protein
VNNPYFKRIETFFSSNIYIYIYIYPTTHAYFFFNGNHTIIKYEISAQDKQKLIKDKLQNKKPSI